MTINDIRPIRHTTAISIDIRSWDSFKKVFWSDKVYNFHVVQKNVSGDTVKFEVRSMRVNEFCDILDKNKIQWKLLDEDVRLRFL